MTQSEYDLVLYTVREVMEDGENQHLQLCNAGTRMERALERALTDLVEPDPGDFGIRPRVLDDSQEDDEET